MLDSKVVNMFTGKETKVIVPKETKNTGKETLGSFSYFPLCTIIVTTTFIFILDTLEKWNLGRIGMSCCC